MSDGDEKVKKNTIEIHRTIYACLYKTNATRFDSPIEKENYAQNATTVAKKKKK